MLVGLDAENNIFDRKAQLGIHLEIKGDQKKHLYAWRNPPVTFCSFFSFLKYELLAA